MNDQTTPSATNDPLLQVCSNGGLGLPPKRMKFADVCALVPEGVHWGEHLTPQIALELVEAAMAAERERVRGGNDLEAMCEAFHRLIEAHAQRSPFHHPVVADAQMALRVLRGVVAVLTA